jgi:general secretion pathway protein D
VIDQLDSRRAQVYIEALIIEVSTSKADQFGVQWAALSGNSNSTIRAGTVSTFNTVPQNNLFTLAAAGKAAVPGPGLNFGLFSSSLGLGAIASALQTSGNANVLSVPTVTTLDNEEAKMLVGQNVPFVTGSYASTGASTGGTVNPFQTVERKDVGVILKVRPQISEGGSVRLSIYQEVSNVDATSNPAGIITDVRALETNVIVDDGEVLVLGGLMSEDSSAEDDQVPLLGDIPYLGNLFKYKTKTHDKRNLLIFLRPTVIRNHDQSNSVSMDRYDYMRAKVKTDRSNDPLLNVPAMSPEVQGILVPQNILKREATPNRLDQQSDKTVETAPVTNPDTTPSGAAK